MIVFTTLIFVVLGACWVLWVTKTLEDIQVKLGNLEKLDACEYSEPPSLNKVLDGVENQLKKTDEEKPK